MPSRTRVAHVRDTGPAEIRECGDDPAEGEDEGGEPRRLTRKEQPASDRQAARAHGKRAARSAVTKSGSPRGRAPDKQPSPTGPAVDARPASGSTLRTETGRHAQSVLPLGEGASGVSCSNWRGGPLSNIQLWRTRSAWGWGFARTRSDPASYRVLRHRPTWFPGLRPAPTSGLPCRQDSRQPGKQAADALRGLRLGHTLRLVQAEAEIQRTRRDYFTALSAEHDGFLPRQCPE